MGDFTQQKFTLRPLRGPFGSPRLSCNVTRFTVRETDRPDCQSGAEFVLWLTDRDGARAYSRTMSAKYYTQFRLTDASYQGGNEFSGVVELSRPMDHDSDVTDIEAVLAKNFDLQRSEVQLVSWSRLH